MRRIGASRNPSKTHRGSRLANRIAVAQAFLGLTLLWPWHAAAVTGDTYMNELVHMFGWVGGWLWLAAGMAYCFLSPAVLPELVRPDESVRPRGVAQRFKMAAFYMVLIWGLVAIAGIGTPTGAADMLARFAASPLAWVLVTGIVLYCLASPVLVPPFDDKERTSKHHDHVAS